MERWHALSHAPGVPLGVVALVLTVAGAVRYGDSALVLGCVLYGCSLVLLYGSSALYHAVTGERLKRFFRACDHACIYLLIAGTYSPFLLGPLSGKLGWSAFGTIWGLATAGLVATALRSRLGGLCATLLYLGMGWLALFLIVPLWRNLPASSFVFLFAGGVLYTVGTIFYGWRAWSGGHLTWHLFVLSASFCHLVSILLFITPPVSS